MQTPYKLLATIAILALAIAPPANATKPAAKPYVVHVTKVPDGDTFTGKRSDGTEARFRVHWSDTPEVAHNSKEVDQPGGVAARDFTARRILEKDVTVYPRSKSWDRTVVDVKLETGKDLGFELAKSGNAWLDPLFKPPAEWQAAQKAAQTHKIGIWKTDPTPPWKWREKTREDARRRASGRP